MCQNSQGGHDATVYPFKFFLCVIFLRGKDHGHVVQLGAFLTWAMGGAPHNLGIATHGIATTRARFPRAFQTHIIQIQGCMSTRVHLQKAMWAQLDTLADRFTKRGCTNTARMIGPLGKLGKWGDRFFLHQLYKRI